MKLFGRSLYVFNYQNPFRRFCGYITNLAIFDNIIIVLILISTLTLAFEHPLADPQSQKMKNLEYIDMGMTIAFCIEALMKIITFGFLFNGRKSYLRNAWNILDFFIVVTSVISLSIDSGSLSVVKVIRVARILRPLRLI